MSDGAPFSGWIANREVSRGEYVVPGRPLFELVSLDPIEVEFSVAERDSARVHIGQQVGVVVAPYPDETFQGEVTVISPIVDTKTRTLRVKARIANPDGRLRPGLFARTDLGIAERQGALLVPEEAVLQRSDGEVVFVVGADNPARRVVVKTGIQREGRVEIVEGLGAEDEVVVSGHAALVDGSPIRAAGPRPPRPKSSRSRLAPTPGAGGSLMVVDRHLHSPPVLTWMLTLSLVVFGALGFVRLGVDQYPKMELPMVNVTSVLEGAAPR